MTGTRRLADLLAAAALPAGCGYTSAGKPSPFGTVVLASSPMDTLLWPGP